MAGQQRRIRSDRDKAEAIVQDEANVFVTSRQETCWLPRCLNALTRIDIRFVDVGMAWLPDEPHIPRQIGGTDEDAVNPINRRYRLNLAQGGLGFDLNKNADLIIRATEIPD